MNKVTRDIMAILKCDVDHALLVQQHLVVDLSECSQRAFVADVKATNQALRQCAS